MKRNTTKTKLFATIISMVSALALLAVGVFATLTNFQVAIANQLNLKFDAVEGTLYATRLGDVAGTDRTTSKVLSESTTATDWLKVYDGTTTEGVQNDALTSIQEKVNFISNDAVKEKVNAGVTSIAITYYFYYTLPTDAISNDITLSAPAVADVNVAITYSYIKATSATLPDFAGATTLTDGDIMQLAGGEHLFIKAEARVSLKSSVTIDNADWSFTLNFGISKFSLNGDILTFNSVAGAETYELWAKEITASGTSLLAQTSSVGDTDSTLGTLKQILSKDTTSVDLYTALNGLTSGDYAVVIVPKDANGAEIIGNRIKVNYELAIEITITFNTISKYPALQPNHNGYAGVQVVVSFETGDGVQTIKTKAGTLKEILTRNNLYLLIYTGDYGESTKVTAGNFEELFYDTFWDQGTDLNKVFDTDTAITFYYSYCFTADTEILVYDEKEKKYKKKKITDITYDDNIVCWDFDNGKLTTAKPIWIKKPAKATEIYRLTYSNGSYVEIVGEHGVFSAEDGKFAGTPKEYKLGTTNFTHTGEGITLVKVEKINRDTTSHTIITNYHMNCFTNDILTSITYNNIYPIKDKKFVKDNRRIRAFEEFNVPREYYDGFRLGEQQEKSITRINGTINTTFVQGKQPRD